MKSCVYYDAILSVWSFLHKIIFDNEKWDTNSVVHRNISPLPHPIFHTFYEHMRTKKHALIPITHPIYMTFYKQLRTKKHVIIPLLVDCSCFFPEFDPLAWGALTVIAWWDLELGGGQTYLGVGALMTTKWFWEVEYSRWLEDELWLLVYLRGIGKEFWVLTYWCI